MSKVAVVKGSRGHRPVLRALELIDYKKALAGWKRALIKVNFISTRMWETGTTTDPIVVEAVINGLRELPFQVYVLESDATMTNADRAYEATGMREMCERNGVKWINLRHVKEKVTIPVPDS